MKRGLFWATFGVLVALLVEVLFESWVQIQSGSIVGHTATGAPIIDVPSWPKTLKSTLYVALALLTVAKVAVDRRWRAFTTPADLALLGLVAALAIAGLASSPSVVLEGMFVYLRGAIVFYAWRALDPPWRLVRPVLWVLGSIVALNALIASLQIFFGRDSYVALGWLDMTWARIFRAHALFDHPNHLGHVAGLALLGLLSWFVAKPSVGRRWWLLFGLFALGLSATQSRESALAVIAGAAVIWWLRRDRTRVVAAGLVIVLACVAAQLALRPGNRHELERRLEGVLAALHLPSGAEPDDYCVENNEGCVDGIPQREIRILYAQQGFRLLLGSPLVGYGVGTFGGIVAYQNDPQWNLDGRFVDRLGAKGFDLHGFNAKQVDSFWLHLTVETGLLGLAAYLLWLFLLALPLLRSRDGPFVSWGLSALVFAVLVAGLSSSLEDPLFPPLLFTIVGLAWKEALHDQRDSVDRVRVLGAQPRP